MNFSNSIFCLLRVSTALRGFKILLLSLLGFIQTANADLTSCVPDPNYANPVPFMQSISINTTSYVGNELPIGSVITRIDFKNTGSSILPVICQQNSPTNVLYENIVLTSSPFGSPITMADGKIVYPTNISGVGVSLSTNRVSLAYLSTTTPIKFLTYDTLIRGRFAVQTHIIVELIKTGTIVSGSHVDAASFPGIHTYADPGPHSPAVGLPMDIGTTTFNGTINFISSTCTTPNVDVDMGTHSIGQNTFSGVGSATRWVDASILLQHCPTFPGRFSGDVDASGAARSYGYLDAFAMPTLLTVSLTPMGNTSSDGKIEVDAVGSSGAAARGVAIQLGYYPSRGRDPREPPPELIFWTPGASWDMRPEENDGRSDMKIPISARYIQTENTVTPGPANARVTFNIDYK
jgi:type 1 fimbria pilin